VIAVVDTGPLYAAADTNDRHHARCASLFADRTVRLVLPVLVVGEVTQLLEKRLGPAAEASFLRGIEGVEIDSPQPDDWRRVAELVERYSDFPLGTVDASVVGLAERLGTDTVITLDQRHFRAVRPRYTEALRLLPE
jgi:predicted nucleic acid-binding protein